MTNADKIRSMSDEELEACLTKIINGGFEWFDARTCNLCKEAHGGECPEGEIDDVCANISREVLDWLKEDAEN